MKTNLKKNLPMVVAMMILIIGGMSCKSNKKLTDTSQKEPKEATMDKPVIKEETVIDEDDTEDTSESSLDEKSKAKFRLADYFAAISSAPSVASANKSIQEALSLFDTPETLVLIVINESNGKKDYDRPTTIKEYLNYLKDQKKNINRISELKMNDSGEITELELTKK